MCFVLFREFPCSEFHVHHHGKDVEFYGGLVVTAEHDRGERCHASIDIVKAKFRCIYFLEIQIPVFLELNAKKFT